MFLLSVNASSFELGSVCALLIVKVLYLISASTFTPLLLVLCIKKFDLNDFRKPTLMSGSPSEHRKGDEMKNEQYMKLVYL